MEIHRREGHRRVKGFDLTSPFLLFAFFTHSFMRKEVIFMKSIIGYVVATIGAKFWTIGGWTGDEEYEDLNVFGKLGYQLLCEGIKLMLGVTDMEDAKEIIEQRLDSLGELR